MANEILEPEGRYFRPAKQNSPSERLSCTNTTNETLCDVAGKYRAAHDVTMLVDHRIISLNDETFLENERDESSGTSAERWAIWAKRVVSRWTKSDTLNDPRNLTCEIIAQWGMLSNQTWYLLDRFSRKYEDWTNARPLLNTALLQRQEKALRANKGHCIDEGRVKFSPNDIKVAACTRSVDIEEAKLEEVNLRFGLAGLVCAVSIDDRRKNAKQESESLSKMLEIASL